MRVIFTIIILLASPVNCLAGYLGGELQNIIMSSDVDDEIPVIVYFKNKPEQSVDMVKAVNALKSIKDSDFKDRKSFKNAYKKARKAMRRQHIESMKLDADFSSKQTKKVLRLFKKNVKRDLWLVNALAINLPPNLINIISNLSQVDHIDFDAVIQLAGSSVSNSNSPSTWNLDSINSTALNNDGIIGDGMVIASMDTGVDVYHPDLAPGWRGGTNSWYDPYQEYSQPSDASGHGSQVMGVMVGGDASGKKIGVAPGAQWIAVKIFRIDPQTNKLVATFSAIHSGFQWLLDPDGDPLTDDAPDIVNNSWGSTSSLTSCDDTFHADVDALKQAGIEVVFAAGNAGPSEFSLYSPADYSQVVSVGSVDEFMNVANTSSRGGSNCSSGFFPNLAAPGVGIFTSDLSLLGQAVYTTVNGTSFAAPHLTGVIALLKSAVPTASHDDIRNALYTSAVDLGSPGQDNVTGYGFVDAKKALLKLRCPAGNNDSDGDGWYDACDNCTLDSNKLQVDTDSDGYGNACDVDLNNDGIANVIDIPLLEQAFLSGSLIGDVNEDGVFNVLDIPSIEEHFLSAPGPSAFAP